MEKLNYSNTLYSAYDEINKLVDGAVASLSVSGTTITYYNGLNSSMGTIKTKDTTYSVATTSSNGLISSDMVTKLSGIASGATNVTSATVASWGFRTVDNDTHYSATLKVGTTNSATTNAATSNSATYINLVENGTIRDSHQIIGTGTVAITADTNGKITISGTDTNTDTKVTEVGNHYTPTSSTSKSATGGTDTNITNLASGSGVNVVTGLDMDAAGHITGVKSVALRSVDTNTHYTTKLTLGTSGSTTNTSTTNATNYLNLFDDSTLRNTIQITGSDAVSVTANNGIMTISAHNTTYSSLKNPYALTISGSSAVTYDGSASSTVSMTKSFVGLGNVDNVSVSSIIGSAMASGNTFSGTLASTVTATTQSSTDNSSKIATTAFVKNAFAAVDAIVYKGTIAGTSTALGAYTVAANKGDLYKVSSAGYVNGIKVEVGDMLICNTDSTSASTSSTYTTIASNWDIIQTNTDVFAGATASANGTTGLVPAPTSGNQAKFLRADGTWQTPTDTNTHYTTKVTVGTSGTASDTSATNSNTYINVFDDTTLRKAVQITGTSSASISANNGVITVTATDTKVTAVGNHYIPTSTTSKVATGGTLTDITNSTSGIQVLTGLDMDAAGHITGVKSVALKSTDTNSNTDTLVTQTVTTTSASYPLLFKNTTSTSTVTDTARFGSTITANPNTGAITASEFIGKLTGTASYATNADMVDSKHASDFASVTHTHSYLPLSGGTITGALTVSSGITGNLTGLSDSATNDAGGNDIRSTYVSSIGVSGKTVTYYNKSGIAIGSFTTQDTDTHYTTKVTVGTSGATSDTSAVNSNTYINIFDNTTLRKAVQITGASSATVSANSGIITITATDTNTNTDSKVTNTLNTSSIAYLTGTTNSATNTGTQVFDTGVYLTATAGELYAGHYSGSSANFTGNMSAGGTVSGNSGTFTNATVSSNATISGNCTIEGTLTVASFGSTITGTVTSATNASNASNATNASNVTGTIASAVTATTQSATDSSTKVATTAFVKNAFAAVDAIVYKGTIAGSTSGTVSMLPAANKGDLYKVSTAGYVGTNKVEVGDMLICNTDSTASGTVAKWDIIQTNTDVFTGATASANGTTGLVPSPTSGSQTKYLKGDGTWSDITSELEKLNSVNTVSVATITSGIAINETYNLPSSYIVGSNDLFLSVDGVTLIKGIDYNETGTTGSESSSITFLKSLSDNTHNIREVVLGRNVYIDSDKLDDVFVNVMVGATATTDGSAGIVPQPTKDSYNKFLKGDGTWATVETGDTKVSQTITTTSASYPVLFKNTASSATVTDTTRFGSSFTINPGTSTMSVPTLSVNAIVKNATSISSSAYTITSASNDYTSISCSGNITLTFTPASSTIFARKTIRLTATSATTLTVANATWANNEIDPVWGVAGYHLMFDALFADGVVILHIIDNDQCLYNVNN